MRVPMVLQLSILLVSLAGCYADPFRNPGDWSITGASGKNIAAQAATPSQLIIGQPDSTSSGVAASAAIDKALGGPAGSATGLETVPAVSSLSITGS